MNDHVMPQLDQLIRQYHPDILWFDGDWDLPASYWRSGEALANYLNHAANEDPPREVVINDRIGAGLGWRGDFATAEYRILDGISDAYWEATRGIGKSFGFNAMETKEYYISTNEIIDTLVDVVSKNGNLLLNIGPKADGSVIQLMKDRLAAAGDWLEINGEAIYGTRHWDRFGDGSLRYTTKDGRFYILSLDEPETELVVPSDLPIAPDSQLTLLGPSRSLSFTREESRIVIHIPEGVLSSIQHAWVIKVDRP